VPKGQRSQARSARSLTCSRDCPYKCGFITIPRRMTPIFSTNC
jgi:hypothetical protein